MLRPHSTAVAVDRSEGPSSPSREPVAAAPGVEELLELSGGAAAGVDAVPVGRVGRPAGGGATDEPAAAMTTTMGRTSDDGCCLPSAVLEMKKKKKMMMMTM